MKSFNEDSEQMNNRLENGLFNFDTSNLAVVDEINDSADSIHDDSSNDDDIQFIEEIQASSSTITESRKRTLDNSKSGDRVSNGSLIEEKRQKLVEKINGVERLVSMRKETEYVADEYLIGEPGNSSSDINEAEIQILYTTISEESTTSVRKPNGNFHVNRNLPSLDQDIWKKIEAYREKYPKKFAHFDNQILKHYELNIQNDATFAWKMQARMKILTAIQRCYPNAELFVVGSTINGCGSFNADMDLCCSIKRERADYAANDRTFATKALSKIRKQLCVSKFQIGMKDCLLIRAKVPILRLTFNHPHDNLEVDLNVNNLAGVYNSYLLHYYSRVDDRFPALCLLVKHWAKRNSIGDAMNGMLNSYSIILLVIHFLQVAISPPILPNLQKCYPELFHERRPLHDCLLFQDLERNFSDPSLNEKTPGELLIAFFDYYANFDFDNWGISIAEARVFSRDDLAASTERFKIFIEEPFDKNNTARCVTSLINFDIIKETFRSARSWFLGKRRPDIRHIGVQEYFTLDG